MITHIFGDWDTSESKDLSGLTTAAHGTGSGRGARVRFAWQKPNLTYRGLALWGREGATGMIKYSKVPAGLNLISLFGDG